MLILLAAIFAIHIIGIILLLVATIDNVSPLAWLLAQGTYTHRRRRASRRLKPDKRPASPRFAQGSRV